MNSRYVRRLDVAATLDLARRQYASLVSERDALKRERDQFKAEVIGVYELLQEMNAELRKWQLLALDRRERQEEIMQRYRARSLEAAEQTERGDAPLQ
jgi:hypothetical protein